MTAPVADARFALVHLTTYGFDQPVRLAPHEIRLRPAPHAHARIASYALAVEPHAHTLHWQQDACANWVARVTFPQASDRLVLRVEMSGEMVQVNPFDFFVDPDAARFPFGYAQSVRHALGPYLTRPQSGGQRFADWVEHFGATVVQDEGTIDLLVRLNQLVRRDIDYQVRDEAGIQDAETTLDLSCGSCRDSAWLLIQVLRHFGIAARFVSGYLIELANDATSRDSGGLHAWAEAFVPGAGWIGLDPSSGLLAGSGHVPLACAADPQMAAAVSGTTEVSGVNFAATIEVHRDGVSPVPLH